MIKFFQKEFSKKTKESVTKHNNNDNVCEASPNDNNFFNKLKTRLRNTRENFALKIETLLIGKKNIDANLLVKLEELLLTADLGIETTETIIQNLTNAINRKDLKDTETVLTALCSQLTNILTPCQKPLIIPASQQPFVILTVGVNGAGKTTTIGKLAKQLQASGKKVLLAAGDTFRAAAIEQLAIWGQHNNIPVIAQHTGADSASVIFDALQAAVARQYDVVIADTAGRLHTKDNLMAELKKVIRVLKKLDQNAPHEILLVLDASIGQNAIVQAEKFHAALGITGIALTKLDGTAKGGTLFAIATKLGLPFRFIGIGENVDDLKPFHAEDFVKALFTEQE